MRVLIYLRVSSEGQARKETPIAGQKSACLEYAKKNGYEVDESRDIYIDGGVSGRSTANRFAYKEMLTRLETDQSVIGVIAYDISRVFRGTSGFLNFMDMIEKRGKKFFSVSENVDDRSPAGKLSGTVLAAAAQFFSDQMAEKIKNGMHAKAESGLYPGKAPFGYKNVRGLEYGGKERRWMETDQITSYWVKEIFAKYASGKYSLGRLAKELNEKKCESPTKKPWFSSSIERILKKKTYIGHVDWGGLDNPNGQHEKLIDEKTFYKVQALMKARNYGANKERKHKFLLRGITYCDECGSRITASYHHKNNGKIYAHYGCSKMRHSERMKCSQPGVQTKEIEGQFEKLLKVVQIPDSQARALEEKIKSATEKGIESDKRTLKSLSIQMDNIKVKRKLLLDKFIENNVDKETYEKYNISLNEKELKIKAELEKTNESSSKDVSVLKTALILVRNCHKTYKNAPLEQKIELIQAIFERINIGGKEIKKVFLNKPFSYLCRGKTRRYKVFQQV